MKRIFCATLLFASIHAVIAAEHCVSTETELRVALEAAEASIEPDHVRILSGVIQMAQPLAFSSLQGSTGALKVSGGWEAGCTSRKHGAQWTRLEAIAPPLTISLHPDDDLTVSDLHTINFAGVFLGNDTVGPAVTTLRVSRVAVFSDTFVGDALSMFSDAERIEVDNLLVDAIAGCGVAAATFSDVGHFTMRSSTVVVRKRPDFNGGGAAICFDGWVGAELNASINSIYNSSHGIDVFVSGRPVLMLASAYTSIDGLAEPLDPESSGNLTIPLSFDETAQDSLARFTRIAKSTGLMPELIDSGTPENVLQYPYDVLGRPRGLGNSIDRGAFEIGGRELLFRNGFEGS